MLGEAFQKAGIKPDDFKKNIKKQSPQKKPQPKEKKSNQSVVKADLPQSGLVKLKVTALSPLHIGSGQVYEPLHFIIDKNFLYEFELEAILPHLSEEKRVAFLEILQHQNQYSFAKVNKFIKENAKDIAKQYAHTTIKVSNTIQNEYNKKVGEVVQIEGKGKFTKKVFHKFEIEKTQKKQIKSEDGTYRYIGYIPGSSFKGAISTAFREFVYKNEGKQLMDEKFEKSLDITNHIFKNFKVSDSIPKEVSTSIGYAINKERFEDDKDSQMNRFIEVIEPKSEFVIDINYDEMLNGKKVFDICEIFSSCNSHYKPILDSLVSEDEICEYLEDSFYKKCKQLQLKPNQFILRVGKHSGARAVSIDGLRKIAVKLCEIKNNNKDSISDEERIEKRVERLYKKSRFENIDDITRLMVDESLITEGKEMEMYQLSKDFLYNPSNIEHIIRENSRKTIQAFLSEETTTWLYGNHPRENQGLLPFGWVLCEIIKE